jgi:hypothetical protein
METQEVGRVVRIGRGWVEVDQGGRLRRVTLPAALLARVGSYVKLRGGVAVSVIGTGELSALRQARNSQPQ